jgi:hypothetical protein
VRFICSCPFTRRSSLDNTRETLACPSLYLAFTEIYNAVDSLLPLSCGFFFATLFLVSPPLLFCGSLSLPFAFFGFAALLLRATLALDFGGKPLFFQVSLVFELLLFHLVPPAGFLLLLLELAPLSFRFRTQSRLFKLIPALCFSLGPAALRLLFFQQSRFLSAALGFQSFLRI